MSENVIFLAFIIVAFIFFLLGCVITSQGKQIKELQHNQECFITSSKNTIEALKIINDSTDALSHSSSVQRDAVLALADYCKHLDNYIKDVERKL